MPNIAIVGAQWGDEGKGKLVDLFTEKVQAVARFNGGHNAGHTIRIGSERFVLRLIPSGILHPGILCLMGNGMVIDPVALEQEMGELRQRGVDVDEQLVISDRAHLILPHHRALEQMAEDRRGARKIGTTQRGIGPAYEDKAARRGLRMADLLRPEGLPDKLADARAHYETICRGAGRTADVDWDALVRDLTAFGERRRARIQDTGLVLHRHLAQGYSVLFEGAQATLLDIDHGSYPYVTSSHAGAAGAVVGLGVPPARLDGVVGVAKAYTTRVGGGPLPSEIGGTLEDRIRERGGEFGTVTGRPRRCGWFDAVVARYAVRVNGLDTIALTKLDVLDELPEIPVCVGYDTAGGRLDEFPADMGVLEGARAVYEKMPGWGVKTAGIREYRELPEAARRYVERIADLSGCEVGVISTGPERRDTILRAKSAMAGWFD
jgi:adenylosuccinate synthase